MKQNSKLVDRILDPWPVNSSRFSGQSCGVRYFSTLFRKRHFVADNGRSTPFHHVIVTLFPISLSDLLGADDRLVQASELVELAYCRRSLSIVSSISPVGINRLFCAIFGAVACLRKKSSYRLLSCICAYPLAI